jgi:hypothetical protein
VGAAGGGVVWKKLRASSFSFVFFLVPAMYGFILFMASLLRQTWPFGRKSDVSYFFILFLNEAPEPSLMN